MIRRFFSNPIIRRSELKSGNVWISEAMLEVGCARIVESVTLTQFACYFLLRWSWPRIKVGMPLRIRDSNFSWLFLSYNRSNCNLNLNFTSFNLTHIVTFISSPHPSTIRSLHEWGFLYHSQIPLNCLHTSPAIGSTHTHSNNYN